MKVKTVFRPKRIMAVVLSLLMIFSVLPVMSASAGTNKFATYSLQDILNLTNLPVININVEGGVDVDRVDKENKRNMAEFSITNAGKYDTTVLYANNPMTIKGRGNSSWTMDTGKKPYNIKFDSKVNLLGLGKNKSWSLISSWIDSTFIRNYIAYKTGKLLNTSAMDCELVELCINGTYEGIYLLTEKYGLGDTRVATAGDGYDVDGNGEIAQFLIEADSRAIENNEPNRFQVNSGIHFVVKDPDEEDLSSTDQCFLDLIGDMNDIDAAINGLNNYEDLIDIDSLIDVYILNELFKNPDFGYGNQPCYSSTFMYKEEGGKLYFGTIWDFDIAMGRNDYAGIAAEGNRDTASPQGFLIANTSWISRLLTDTYFAQRLQERWTQIRPVLQGVYDELIPDAIEKVSATQAADFAVWGAAGNRTTTWNYRTPLAFEAECNYVNNFLSSRMAWLDTQWLQPTTITDNDIYWTRNPVTQTGSYSNLISEGAQYADEALVDGSAPSSVLGIYNGNASAGIDNIFDGGRGIIEVGGTETSATYGVKQVVEPSSGGAITSPITITGPTGIRYNWNEGSAISSGFGGTVASKTISNSGRYIYCCSPDKWWFDVGITCTMGTDYIFIVDVAADGSVTAYDGSVTIGGGDATIQNTNYSLLTKNSDTNYTLSFSSSQQGNSGTTLGGGGSSEPIDLFTDESFSGTLNMVNRPSSSVFAGTPVSAEEVYINFEGANPASWSIVNKATGQPDNGNIVKFKESSMKVTANSAGTVVITATTAAGATDSIEISVAASTGDIVTGQDTSKGIYVNSIEGSRDEQGNWATVNGNSVTRFTGYVDLASSAYAGATGFFLATEDRDALLGGKADYYIYVNGTPYIKAVYGSERLSISDSFASTFTIASNTAGLGGYERYKSSQGYVADISTASSSLKGLLHSGANRIDIIVVSDENTAIFRPYLYSNLSDEIIEEVDVTGVTLNTNAASLYVGESTRLIETVSPIDATNKAVIWSSNAQSVATVDTSGNVTAVAPGTAVITATTVDGGYTASCTVTVSKMDITVSINNGAASVSISQYANTTLNATVAPSVSDNSVTWSSSNNAIASVDANGVVTGNIVGNAVITARSNYDNTVTDTITVYVTTLNFNLTIGCRSTSFGLNEVMTLTPTFSANIPNKGVTWQIKGSGAGYMKGNVFCPTAAGTVTVTCRSNYDPFTYGTIVLTIDPAHYGLMGISPINSIVSIAQGETAQLGVTYNPTNASNKTLTWQSIYPEYVTVDAATGVVTGVSAGTGMILAISEDGGRTALFAVHVTAPAPTISINQGNSVSMTDLGTTTLSATLTNTTYNSVSWRSSDTSVATVNGGVVTAHKPGTVTITAEYTYDATLYDTISVTVNKANVSVAITSGDSVSEGGTLALAATVSPAVYDTSVTWSVVNGTGSATLSGGTLTGVSAGTVIVTATSVYDTAKTASYTVTVTPQSSGGGETIYAPAFSATQATYPRGAVVYNPADGKYYVFTNSQDVGWTNTGAIDSSWTEVTNDLSSITSVTSGSYPIGVICLYNGSYYANVGVYNPADITWSVQQAFWNKIPSEYSQYFNVGTSYSAPLRSSAPLRNAPVATPAESAPEVAPATASANSVGSNAASAAYATFYNAIG